MRIHFFHLEDVFHTVRVHTGNTGSSPTHVVSSERALWLISNSAYLKHMDDKPQEESLDKDLRGHKFKHLFLDVDHMQVDASSHPYCNAVNPHCSRSHTP
eukprot:10509910-Karenia_brevis.AAC.1